MVFKNGDHEGGVPYTIKADQCAMIDDLGFVFTSM